MSKLAEGIMKRLLLASVAAVGLVIPGAGLLAADMPVKAPPVPYVPPQYNWTGFYIGANVGGGAATATIFDSLTDVSAGSVGRSAFIGGGQIGYNYQFSPYAVVGVEWFFDGIAGNNNTSTFFAPVALNPLVNNIFQASGQADWVTTITARLGVTGPQMDHVLVYTKGGGGWAQTQASLTDLTVPATLSVSKTTGGWVWGAGIEWAFAQNWTAKFEYQYIGLSNIGLNPGLVFTPFNAQNVNVQTVTVGVNYLFNYAPAPAPVVSRY